MQQKIIRLEPKHTDRQFDDAYSPFGLMHARHAVYVSENDGVIENTKRWEAYPNEIQYYLLQNLAKESYENISFEYLRLRQIKKMMREKKKLIDAG